MQSIKDIARSFTDEVFGEGKLELIDKYCTADCVHSDPILGKLDNRGLKDFVIGMREAFPDVSLEAVDVIAEGDLVAVRWEATGTHRGTFLNAPGSGRRIELEGLDLMHFKGGKVVSAITHFNTLGFMQQLGLVPKLEEPKVVAEKRPS